ncbi:PDZ domain-containing protein [Lutimonas saemankumensis]|uniref:S41 family peptidase n=1 Tax=Lutimonas saemankumensis TaxID=483016 RepID=UPI001CD3F62F|nr:S41 family peptidase [Lutimonas saemankumensis]MCA0931742.1 PDZ domain-containing protein [Lutimonas saemankumensis]
MKNFIILLLVLVSLNTFSQINAKLMRHVDVSENQICFVYGGDIWLVDKKGGMAIQLTNSPGEESYPKFSPNGQEIAFTASYRGNPDIYVMSVLGGLPQRITYGSHYDRMVEWHPSGEKILFASRRETGIPSGWINQFFLVPKIGGIPEKLPIPYGQTGTFSPDGKQLAYITKITENYPFKRYRGGLTSDVILFDLENKTAKNITDNVANDGKPAWANDKIYFTSDRADNMRLNVWSYDINTESLKQVTEYDDFDISFLSAGPKDLVYEVGGVLYTMDLGSEQSKEVQVTVVDDLTLEMNRRVKVDKKIKNMTVSPSAKRIVLEARGELFNLPVKEGYVKNITSSSGAFDQNPSWSPSGDFVAYWSDKSGEYEIYLQPMRKDAKAKKLTSRNKGFGYKLHWSPNSKKIAFIDEKNNINIVDVSTGTIEIADNFKWNYGHGGRYRDFFYDENMQQVDWQDLRTRYGSLIKDARSRWDVSFLQSNLLSELSAGHTYTFGGDNQNVESVNTGFLGIDWSLDTKGYRIKRIVKPASWDAENRSPFDRPGVKVSEGDYIHSVNGMSLPLNKDPYAAFEGLDGKTVTLKISKTGNLSETKEIIVTCLTPEEEGNIRYLDWIEQNRLRVEELSDGKLGYVYMTNTGGRGQLDLVKMYYGQLDKEGFIIDERFNGGGQLADRFLELMLRPVIYNLYWRHGKSHTFPVKANTGPMGMLINGWAGSGGDGLPWAFRELDAGPIVGERTVGILVGPATGHELIDGGGITVPGARLYYNNGKWFDEGVGVKPDFAVWDDPNLLMKDRDPQMEKVVNEVMKLLESNPGMATPPPAMQDRTANGLNKN